jgi:hypothetical protein
MPVFAALCCPFCGNENVAVDDIAVGQGTWALVNPNIKVFVGPRTWAVVCQFCKAVGPNEPGQDMATAVARWNATIEQVAAE